MIRVIIKQGKGVSGMSNYQFKVCGSRKCSLERKQLRKGLKEE